MPTVDSTKSSALPPARTSPLEQIADRIEEEIQNLRARRPHLEARIDRAAGILVTHLACPRQRVIRFRIAANGRGSFLVNGSGGAVYTVDPTSWTCSCPDHHRRDAICKHALASFLLMRASLPARVQVRECDGCQQTFARRDLVEVQSHHESDQWFPGDFLCKPCAGRGGVEW